jgi:exportin-T
MAQLADFERAVVFLVDQQANAAADPAVKQQATDFCDQVKRSPDGWRYNFELLTHTSRVEVRFFALQSLQWMLGSENDAVLPSNHREELRGVLLRWLIGTAAEPHATFMKTKIALVLTLLVKRDYPERWPSAFVDLQSLLSQGPPLIDVYLRVFVAINEEIVEFDAQVQQRPVQSSA